MKHINIETWGPGTAIKTTSQLVKRNANLHLAPKEGACVAR